VEGFIDRLAGFLKSLFRDERDAGGEQSAGPSNSARFRDPDMQDAWDELNDYMRTGTQDSARRNTGEESTRRRAPVDESLRQDYANLEVPFGSDIETVRRSYKALMIKYHPDKHGADPREQKIALEITKKINESFERIRTRSDRESSPS
jgi:hypothetical protein